MVQLSEIMGFCSIGCWIVVIAPQLVVNYRRKSGEGLSLTFLLLWLFADLFSLTGAILNNLFYSVILLAAYYTLIDLILMAQWYYYRSDLFKRSRRHRHRRASVAKHLDPEHGLGCSAADTSSGDRKLADETKTKTAVPGAAAIDDRDDAITLVDEKPNPVKSTAQSAGRMLLLMGLVAVNVYGMSAVSAVSVSSATGFSGRVFAAESAPVPAQTEHLIGDIMGYVSAVLYVSSRVPQIAKNFRERSCEGLSALMFVFTVCGNLTYCASILCYSIEPEYLVKNTPWLLGALGTLLLDFIIFAQFYMYRPKKAQA
ncbi:PQ loop repeat-domain-containing protein [Polychytrium aggregatum]|uniref:PQ loop repeat-domain-containing protein n=1 Tax=Polychytrium aggregatum TaxID=110093 RepID=UPI0022FE97DA|nr:PQ loop repeat-domain-containing protein [Polychytrium aggregatum]KAI9202711.1 PQ loop repeat-domain-containing protein [Polychytrium aggregatum]